jgi:hypothetical protein
MSVTPFENYLAKNKLIIIGGLGKGKDGEVFKTDRDSAIKKLKTPELYRR